MRFNRHFLVLHIAVLLLGMTGLFAKFLDVNPVTIISGRSFFTVLFILLCTLFLKQSLRVRSFANLGWLCLSGVVLSIHWFTFFHSIQISTVAIGVIGFSTFPVFVTFLEPLLFGEKIRRIDAGSGILVFVGLLFVVPDFNFSNEVTIALCWAVLSGFLAAVFTLVNRKLAKQNHFLVVTFYQHLVAVIVTLPMVWGLSLWPMEKDIWLLALLGIVFTAVPQAMLVKSLELIKAQVVSVLIGLEPLYSIVFAVILLHEIPTLTTLIGGAFVASAVVLATHSHTRLTSGDKALKRG